MISRRQQVVTYKGGGPILNTELQQTQKPQAAVIETMNPCNLAYPNIFPQQRGHLSASNYDANFSCRAQPPAMDRRGVATHTNCCFMSNTSINQLTHEAPIPSTRSLNRGEAHENQTRNQKNTTATGSEWDQYIRAKRFSLICLYRTTQAADIPSLFTSPKGSEKETQIPGHPKFLPSPSSSTKNRGNDQGTGSGVAAAMSHRGSPDEPALRKSRRSHTSQSSQSSSSATSSGLPSHGKQTSSYNHTRSEMCDFVTRFELIWHKLIFIQISMKDINSQHTRMSLLGNAIQSSLPVQALKHALLYVLPTCPLKPAISEEFGMCGDPESASWLSTAQNFEGCVPSATAQSKSGQFPLPPPLKLVSETDVTSCERRARSVSVDQRCWKASPFAANWSAQQADSTSGIEFPFTRGKSEYLEDSHTFHSHWIRSQSKDKVRKHSVPNRNKKIQSAFGNIHHPRLKENQPKIPSAAVAMDFFLEVPLT